ncbi:MAG: sugar phosphate nucleotidyltransferase [bacterium]|nr:sugar phosphate nucleotidyltransferase [bacterium]
MKAVILAGGFGTRLRGLYEEPKCLIDIGGGTTVLEHQVSLLRLAGIHDIRVTLHYKADEVKAYARKFGSGVMCIYEKEPLGTGGAIKFAAQGLREPIVVCNGDIITQIDFSALIAKALQARQHTLSLVAAPAKDFGGVELFGDRIAGFYEKRGGEELAYVNEGFYVLFPGIFEHFPEKFSIEKDCFPRLARRGMLRAYVHRDRWLDVGTPERFHQRTKIL